MLSLVTPLHITVKGNQVNIPELKSGLNNCNGYNGGNIVITLITFIITAM